jgi:hypothetical protein
VRLQAQEAVAENGEQLAVQRESWLADWFKSPIAAAAAVWSKRRRARRRAVWEEVADPEEFCSLERARRGTPLEALPRVEDLDVLAKEYGVDPERLRQAEALREKGLLAKAKRLALCGRIGKRLNCERNPEHKFYRRYRCRGRYCRVCGAAWFRKKFSDLLFVLEPVVERLLHEGARHGYVMVIAKLDFTVRNLGRMPTPAEVRKNHADFNRFRRYMERRFGIPRDLYGILGCDEFGGKNTNWHMHCLYVGPWLPQKKKELSALWTEVRGEQAFVSIKRARSLRAALAHALKYPAKFLDRSTPERLAELEAAFHGTRRLRACGAFYNLKVMREPGEEPPPTDCPLCGAPLDEVVESWVPVDELVQEGRRDIEDVRCERRRQLFWGGPGPP